MTTYIYRGDKLTADEHRNKRVTAVLRADGKTIRGRNGNMLVQDAEGRKLVVLGRQLRKVQP
jgi:protein associated with RNAse G/E